MEIKINHTQENKQGEISAQTNVRNYRHLSACFEFAKWIEVEYKNTNKLKGKSAFSISRHFFLFILAIYSDECNTI